MSKVEIALGKGTMADLKANVGRAFVQFKEMHPEKLDWLKVFKDFEATMPSTGDKKIAKNLEKVYKEIGVECEKVNKWNPVGK